MGVWCAPVRWANRADEDSSEVAGLDGERQVYAGGRKKIAEKERGRRVEYTERRGEREERWVGRTIGSGAGGKKGWDGGSNRRKKPMRFRGRLIGSRTYTYSLSTNPTIRVLIFTPCVISQHPLLHPL